VGLQLSNVVPLTDHRKLERVPGKLPPDWFVPTTTVAVHCCPTRMFGLPLLSGFVPPTLRVTGKTVAPPENITAPLTLPSVPVVPVNDTVGLQDTENDAPDCWL